MTSVVNENLLEGRRLNADDSSSYTGPGIREADRFHGNVSQLTLHPAGHPAPPRASHGSSGATHSGAGDWPGAGIMEDEHPFDAYGLNASTPATASATTSAPPSQPSTPGLIDNMILHDTSHLHVEIQLPSDTIVLRGVGQEVEPVLLSGNVVVNLEEATNIREIALNFTGKARLPQQEGRPAHFRHNSSTYTLFSRDWAFLTLEGTKSHRHTLKAGQHIFPFQLNIDDTFPPSVGTTNSSVTYKLRATVVRSSFTSNWITQKNVNILRGFSPEALEYSQTVEIENTWPGKVMYSIMLPHKAFAAGDSIPALLKFTPIAKGCNVLSIEGTVKQYSSTIWKGAPPMQASKVVARCKYEVHGGVAVDVLSETPAYRKWTEETYGVGAMGAAVLPCTTAGIPGSVGPSVPRASTEQDEGSGDGELTTWVKIPLWKFTAPSSSDEPIVIAYKLKWSIMLSNLDGHTSELRAALPIHVLHHSLLSEARAASHLTRSLLFGTGFEAPPEQSITLPSYASHVHDRVANALDFAQPDARLAPNPLHNIEETVIHASAVNTPSAGGFIVGTLPANGSAVGSRSGCDTPSGGYFSNSRSSHSTTPNTPSVSGLPNSPPNGATIHDSTALQFVDEGLLLSLGVEGSSTRSAGTSSRTDTPPDSRRSSLAIGRVSSTGTTPEHEPYIELPSASSSFGSSSNGGGRSSLFSLKAFTSFGSNKSERGSSGRSSTTGSGSGAALATLATTAFHTVTIPAAPANSRPAGHRFRKSSAHNLRSLVDASSTQSPRTSGQGRERERNTRSTADLLSDDNNGSRPASPLGSASNTGLNAMSALLNRVPDYERASQGFLGGGVTPLDASMGLPTYADIEQVARVRSEGALLDFGRRAAAAGLQERHGRGHPTTSSGLANSASPSDSGGSSPSGFEPLLETPDISVTAASSRSTSSSRRGRAAFTLGP
ncbi:hypothetical protein FRB95_014759 [Tulasnella sp. JGI-2019a]|nr:hypothetical protein FRB95_014759 [Tulasnella sp. JGI-2019a]